MSSTVPSGKGNEEASGEAAAGEDTAGKSIADGDVAGKDTAGDIEATAELGAAAVYLLSLSSQAADKTRMAAQMNNMLFFMCGFPSIVLVLYRKIICNYRRIYRIESCLEEERLLLFIQSVTPHRSTHTG
jgi:hypothetical protein